MAKQPDRSELTREELEAQEASELPDREAMSLIRADPLPPVPIEGDPPILIGPPAEAIADPGLNA